MTVPPLPPASGPFRLNEHLWLDPRRAAWLPHEQTLVVADLHLGHAWTERQRGVLLPVATPDDTAAQLNALQLEYQPRTLVFLGDLVHGPVAIADVAGQLRSLLEPLARRSRLILALGNHDPDLRQRQEELRLPLELVERVSLGPHVGVHGDRPDLIDPPASPKPRGPCAAELSHDANQPGWLLIGHEHPCVTLRDGLATAVRCPCFVIGRRRLILPAFSVWAAGCEVGRRPFLSALATGHAWQQLVAIVGPRCLPLPFPA